MMKNCFYGKLSIFLIGIFLLSSVSIFQVDSVYNNDKAFFELNSTDFYFEDFYSSTYMDGSTNTWGWGTGYVSNFRNFTYNLLDFYQTADPVFDVDIQGRKAYTATYNTTSGPITIGCYNINNPSNIEYCGGRSSWSSVISIAIDGDVLYSGRSQYSSADPGIATYDVTDPFNLELPSVYLTQFLADGSVTDISPEGRIVYYTSFNSTSGYSLRILDAEDPATPRNILNTWASSKALGLDTAGVMVYIAASDEGFYIVNATDKFVPFEVGHVDTPGNATDVLVEGRYAYIADGPAGVSIIDIYDKTNPQIIGHYDTGDNARKLALQGTTLFVADEADGVIILDVADPTHPIFVDRINVGAVVWDVDLYGGILVVGSDQGLHTYRVSNGWGIIDISNSFYSSIDVHAKDVQVQGDYAFVAGGSQGLLAFDVSDPTEPILLDQDIFSAPADYRSIEIKGTIAYICDFGSSNGFYSYDISNPSDLKFLDSIYFSQAQDCVVAGDIAYIADGSFGVYLLNITNPYDIPSAISFFDIFTNVTAVDSQGPLLYVVDNVDSGGFTNSLFIYDMTDLLNEVQVSATSRWDEHHDILVEGDVICLSSEVWCSFYNASNPILPVFKSDTSYLATPIESYGLSNFGPYVISASGSEGVYLINKTNLGTSNDVHSLFQDANAAVNVKTHGDYIYIANSTSLVILRFFESAGATFVSGAVTAQSSEVDNINGEIKKATLTVEDYIPTDTMIVYYLSADGGTHWEAVTPGVEHEFTNTGDELMWKADFIGPTHRSAKIYSLNIDFEYNGQPTTPTIEDLGDNKFTGLFSVKWSEATDDVQVAHYELQMSESLSFTTIVKEWAPTKTSQFVFGLGKGDFYFRVRAVDDEGFASDWSFVESTSVTLSTLITGLIAGGGLLLIVVIIVVIAVVVRKKKKVQTR